MTARLFDSPRADTPRGSNTPVELTLFVHKDLPKSLLCSEHGENRYSNRVLEDGKVIAWTLITWPDEEQREAFRRWQATSESRRQPIALTFAVPEWFAKKEGLI